MLENRSGQNTGESFDGLAFWNGKWQKGQTGWDMGAASPPIKDYISQYENKDAAILIPGCGNAHEAAFLTDSGFHNITLLDIAPVLVAQLKKRFLTRSAVRVLCEDFFTHKGRYDLIIEQTFFCAQLPARRKEYAQKMHDLLNADGKLMGVLFDREFEGEEPPFGGNKEAYETLFAPYFDIHTLEPCRNSILPRSGTELFFIFSKKS